MIHIQLPLFPPVKAFMSKPGEQFSPCNSKLHSQQKGWTPFLFIISSPQRYPRNIITAHNTTSSGRIHHRPCLHCLCFNAIYNTSYPVLTPFSIFPQKIYGYQYKRIVCLRNSPAIYHFCMKHKGWWLHNMTKTAWIWIWIWIKHGLGVD